MDWFVLISFMQLLKERKEESFFCFNRLFY